MRAAQIVRRDAFEPVRGGELSHQQPVARPAAPGREVLLNESPGRVRQGDAVIASVLGAGPAAVRSSGQVPESVNDILAAQRGVPAASTTPAAIAPASFVAKPWHQQERSTLTMVRAATAGK
jgi:hypothetical protein